MGSILGRYVARLLLARLGLVLLGLSGLAMILEVLADGDQVIAASDHPARALLRYTALRLPEIVSQMLPIAALLGGLVTFADLARHQELTAIFATGGSKLRLARAVLPVALLVGAVQLVIEDQALPVTVRELRAWGIGDFDPTGGADGVTWLRIDGDIIRVEAVDPRGGELTGVTIFRRDAAGNLVDKVDAARAAHDDGGWRLYDVHHMPTDGTGARRVPVEAWAVDMTPADLAAVLAPPRETPLRDLLHILRGPPLGAQPGYLYRLWAQERLAAPCTTIALILLTVALARPHSGRMAQSVLILVGLGLGFVCWTFDGLMLSFGGLGLLPPLLAAWSPVALVATIAGSFVVHGERHGRPKPLSGARVGARPGAVAAHDRRIA